MRAGNLVHPYPHVVRSGPVRSDSVCTCLLHAVRACMRTSSVSVHFVVGNANHGNVPWCIPVGMSCGLFSYGPDSHGPTYLRLYIVTALYSYGPICTPYTVMAWIVMAHILTAPYSYGHSYMYALYCYGRI